MTKLDRNVVDIPLLMVLPLEKEIEVNQLQAPYRYIEYRDEYAKQWCCLQTETGLFESLAQAEEKLNTFIKQGNNFKDNFLFVVDENNELVGSAGIWPGFHFGKERARIHYVSVSEKVQGKGIAKAMLTKLCNQYQREGHTEELYLATQTGSYAAINLYNRIGFIPYEEAYQNYTKQEVIGHWKIAWEIIDKKRK